MQVFNGYMKVLKKSIPALIIYTMISVAMYCIFFKTGNDPSQGQFVAKKIDTAFINNDTDSEIIKNFKEYLKEYCNFIDVGTEKEKLDDALFIRKIEYIITIDSDFEERFLNNKAVMIDKKSVPDSQGTFYLNSVINTYFNTLKSYANIMPEASVQELCSLTKETLSESASVNLIRNNEVSDSDAGVQVFFNFMAYTIIATLVTSIGSIMIVFNDINIRRRNMVAPISNRSSSFQMILGNMVYALAFFVILFLVGNILCKGFAFDTGFWLRTLNAFIFLLCGLAISYIVGLLVKSERVLGSIATIISLGLAFIGGSFVPQELLSKTVLKMSKFTPNYWYVHTNNRITEIDKFTNTNLKELFRDMGIEFLFAIALFTISFVIGKKRSEKAE